MNARSPASGAALLAALLPALSYAFPEGAPWEVAGQEGCAMCHFDAPPSEPSDAVTIEGLPAFVTPGAEYVLTVRLEDDVLATAGFLLSAWRETDPAGAFFSDDPRAEADGARARSTEAGSRPAAPGRAEWTLTWRAPEKLTGPVMFDLWANAGNDDQSPFGDATHRRTWTLPPAPAAGAAAAPRRRSGR